MSGIIRTKLLLTAFLFFFAVLAQAQYKADVLDGYLYRTINMPDDYEGDVVCTLIKKPNPVDSIINTAILYIHGYNDYFFQKELGDSIQAHGYNFYALDLRKYGRSILPNQDPFYCKSLTEYFADIDTALAIVRQEGNERVYIMAHSTGGLISPLYISSKGSKPVDGLILNSPFLDMNMSWFLEDIAIPVVSVIGKLFPRIKVQGGGHNSYAHSLLDEHHGEWTFNTDWKKISGHPKRAGWLRAIHQGHGIVQKGLELSCPVLVMSSDKSFTESEEWNEAYAVSDVVLDVNDIRKYGARLGSNISYFTIPDGIHDLILSAQPARDYTYQVIFDWLREQDNK